MPKANSSFELTLESRPHGLTLTSWLYSQFRLAILEGRLRPGTRLPASRDFARLYGISRGTIVSVLERLQSEGYVSSRVGSGTLVNRIEPAPPVRHTNSAPPAYIRRVISEYVRPKPSIDLVAPQGGQPFCMRDPATAEFPAELWGRIAARRARSFRSWVLKDDDGCGYGPLDRRLLII